jgi:adenine-specific DNA methylase
MSEQTHLNDFESEGDKEVSADWRLSNGNAEGRVPVPESYHFRNPLLSRATVREARMTSRQRKKDLGAYYTDPQVARFIVRWAMRSPTDKLLDPAFGDGVFLDAALEQLSSSRSRASQVYGVEFDEQTHRRTIARLSGLVAPENLLLANFFDVEVSSGDVISRLSAFPVFDAVVGNPPFIRYHRFKGEIRKKALSLAASLGVELNGLSSSWAPFVVHAISFVKPRGRFGMVLPAELMHASYALPVVHYLRDSFSEVEILTFKKKLFPNLSQDTVLVLCQGKESRFNEMRLLDLSSAEMLQRELPKGTVVDADAVIEERSRLIEYILPDETRKLYNRLKHETRVLPLRELADIGIGYVTGNNDYFHLTEEQAKRYQIPSEHLLRCVRNGSQLPGLLLREEEPGDLVSQGSANLLLNLHGDIKDLPKAVQDYIKAGERAGIHRSFKCRSRNPWYTVPNIYECQGFLTYMSGIRAKLVVNRANAVAPNTLHIVRVRKPDAVSMEIMAVSWLTSLTMLSTEIEGHSMGGGMLKLEPSEAESTILALPKLGSERIMPLVEGLDALLRRNEWQAANESADNLILIEGMGLSPSEVILLRQGASLLRERRYNR